ncbi:NifB/NifX family molybdenum-iron cluster-binding protein [Vibrio renipiscarius]|uniref:Dinitrogenase iron-molybdenum cofactor biosynthesis domain-containing protein n=1 Tax=Vibrio renipiscarius TaxID=1461322 RepID=A0A0C2JJ65_9VIBR|nr:NifB/NifX family molybdenum-iron cluster-binding protein [Vibrio renipiscarius]KII76454.1 hypothetical protein OJ16_16835 [Vibrio renipiscarius]KII78024.1 hypothetical protein PL18_13735 [Vibrio renipiscarius]
MIYAIPCLDNLVSNHFSRAPQIVIFDQAANTHKIITLTETPSHCGKKKQWMALMAEQRVDAVVVRSIGKKMLRALFDLNLLVLAAPPKAEINQLDYTALMPVTSLDYGKDPKKSTRGCGSQKACGGKTAKTAAGTKSPLMSSLQKGFTMITRIAK